MITGVQKESKFPLPSSGEGEGEGQNPIRSHLFLSRQRRARKV